LPAGGGEVDPRRIDVHYGDRLIVHIPSHDGHGAASVKPFLGGRLARCPRQKCKQQT
jgi:hypothetical protein